jgi:hypothetical protein
VECPSRFLIERGLWLERRADGFKFLLDCPTTGGRTGCDQDEDGNLLGGCCARTVLAMERDFRDRKGRLEELLAEGQELIFYPSFFASLIFLSASGAVQNSMLGRTASIA